MPPSDEHVSVTEEVGSSASFRMVKGKPARLCGRFEPTAKKENGRPVYRRRGSVAQAGQLFLVFAEGAWRLQPRWHFGSTPQMMHHF